MNELFNVLKNGNIKFVPFVPEHLKCIVCRRILIDSCFAPCGCKFCLECAKSYFMDEDKTCPGGKEECSEFKINFFKDIVKDPSRNLEISNLTVQCPHQNCSHKCYLRKLHEHIKTCFKVPINCVFADIGCEVSEIVTENMSEHLDSCNVNHSKLLVAFIKSLDNEMKLRMDECEQRMNESTMDRDRLKNVVWNMRCEIEAIKKEQIMLAKSQRKLTEEIFKVQEEYRSFKEEIENDKSELLLLSKKIEEFGQDKNEFGLSVWSGIVKHTNDLQQGLRIMEENQDRSVSLVNYDDANRIFHTGLTNENKDFLIESNVGSRNISRQNSECLKAIDEVRYALHSLDQHPEGTWSRQGRIMSGQNDFVWKIDDIEKKYQNNKSICSQPFYSDGQSKGYKLRLWFYMSKWYAGLGLAFRLMKGENDDYLKWPMQRVVELEVTNQDSGFPMFVLNVCRSTAGSRAGPEYRRGAYNKPQHDRNDRGDGFFKFKSYSELKLITGVIKDDSMLVKCRVLP